MQVFYNVISDGYIHQKLKCLGCASRFICLNSQNMTRTFQHNVDGDDDDKNAYDDDKLMMTKMTVGVWAAVVYPISIQAVVLPTCFGQATPS